MNDQMSLTDFGVGKFAINSNFDSSTSIHFFDTMWPNTMPWETMKWYFF